MKKPKIRRKTDAERKQERTSSHLEAKTPDL